MPLKTILRAAVLMIAATAAQSADNAGAPNLAARAAPGGAAVEPGTERVLEIRSYNLKPGMVGTFERLFAEQAYPLLAEHGIDVVAYGRSLHDEDSWYLMRAFDDPAHRERAERAFYASDEWRDGPREAVLDCIESYTTVVLPLDEATVEQLRRLMKAL